MIDLAHETVISFSEAAKRLPKRRNRARLYVGTLYRWAQRGCMGSQLEVLQVVGTKCTSLEAPWRSPLYQRRNGVLRRCTWRQ